jgi:micrococcal nuclease
MRRRTPYRYLGVLVVILAIYLLRVWSAPQKREIPAGQYEVTRIIDGDTMELNGREKVRLLGIDTPEKGEPLADSAALYLSTLVKGEIVSLLFDRRPKDNYDRMLAYIFKDTVFVNAALVARGYAHMYIFPDNQGNDSLTARLLTAQREAITGKLGQWRFLHAGESQYIGNAKQMRFHRPGCPSVQNLSGKSKVIFKSREEACYEGYSPCRNCKP